MDATEEPGSEAQRKLADLLAAGDLAEMTAWVTDQDRVDRILAATGDYEAVLADIRAVHLHVSEQDPPDLSAGLKLALARDRVAGRIDRMPVEVPAAWARLGDFARARALARSLQDSYERARAFTLLVRLAEDAGQTRRLADEAEAAARTSVNANQVATALAALAQAVVEAGDADLARRLADEAGAGPTVPQNVLPTLAETLAALGETDRAEAAARAVNSAAARARTLILVARKTRTDRGTRLAEEVEAEARSCRDPLRKAQLLAAIADAAAAAGDANHARLLAAEAQTAAGLVERKNYEHEKVLSSARRVLAEVDEDGLASPPARVLEAAEAEARSIDGSRKRAGKLAVVAGRWAGVGAVSRGRLLAVEAETSACAEPIARVREREWETLAEAWAEAGDLGRAEGAARSATRPSVWTLLMLVRRAAEAGDMSRARRLADEIEAIARAETNDRLDRERALEAAVTAMIAARSLDRAGTIARDMEHPTARASALDLLARAFAEAGMVRRAQHTAEIITHRGEENRTRTALAEFWLGAGDRAAAEVILRGMIPRDEQAGPLADVAAAWAAGGDLGRGLRVADEAEAAARTADAPERRARALAALVGPLARMGRRDRARLVADEAEAAARSLGDRHSGHSALAGLASALTEAGEMERAEALIRSIGNTGYQELPLSGVAQAWATAGDLDRAVAVAAASDSAGTRARTLALSVQIAARAGDLAGARRLADEAEAVARSAAEPQDRVTALHLLADALVNSGELDRAEAMFSAGDLDPRSWAVTGLAVALARVGELDRAGVLARAVPASSRSILINELAGTCDPAWVKRLIAAALPDIPASGLFKTLARVEPGALIALDPQ